MSVCVALQFLKQHISPSQRKHLFSSLQEKKKKGGAVGRLCFMKEKSLLTLEFILQNWLRVIHNASFLNEFISEGIYLLEVEEISVLLLQKADGTHTLWGILSIIFIKY